MKTFKGRTAVITGAASGFGLEVSRIAAARGMHLVMADVQKDALDAAAAEIAGLGAQVLPYRLDVSKAAEVEGLGRATLERFGAPHFVFNNAGVGNGGLLWEVSLADWEWILGVNLMGVVHGVRVFTPMMLEAARRDADYEGHIVNTASMAGLLSPPNMGVYNVSKHAVVSLSETLYQDLRLVTEQVTASVLCPYFVPTGITHSERNRPAELSTEKPTKSQIVAKMMNDKAVSSGKVTAPMVAQFVFDALAENRFYIYSHPHALGNVQTRMEDIITGRNPTDPFAQRPEVGEQLKQALRAEEGAPGAIAATGAATVPEDVARATPAREGTRGLARGLTLLTLRRNGEYRLGVKTGRGVLDVKQAAGLLRMPAPATLDDLLQHQDGANLNALVDAALEASNPARSAFVQEDAVEYGPLVSRPEKIVCVGLNYRKHAKEINMPIPRLPMLFNKFNNTLGAHRGTIKLPVEVATKFDHEVELVIVIGKQARNVSEADAHDVVAGYATGNDLSARDLQLETGGQWMIGKTLDGFAPLGPYLVTADQVDPDNLKIECRVNGEIRQSSSTSDMIFHTRQVISYVSRHFTLHPGDIIFTGTPEGVIQGKAADQRVWLKPGDKVACSVEQLGELAFDLV